MEYYVLNSFLNLESNKEFAIKGATRLHLALPSPDCWGMDLDLDLPKAKG